MSLCELRGVSRPELLASMNNAELTKLWVRHRYISPIPDLSRMLGELTAAVYNTAPYRKRDAPVFEAEDFMPIVKTPEPALDIQQSTDEQTELARQVHQALGGL